jgi:adenine-specific DNA-methyltransferase
MRLRLKSISESLSPALKAHRPPKSAVDQFGVNLANYFAHIDSSESEENLKTHFMTLLKPIYGVAHTIEQYGDVDFVIRVGNKSTPAGVLFESKRAANTAHMIRQDDVNRTALHELVLYYMRERASGNTNVQHLVIGTEHELYIFHASCFETSFFANPAFRKDFTLWHEKKKSRSTTEFFYKEICAKFVSTSDSVLEATYVDLSRYGKLSNGSNDKALIDLYKIIGPHYLLNEKLANDSNSLNKAFYDELLHIIGLVEIKDGNKRIISRLDKEKRNSASLLENAISHIRLSNDFNNREMIIAFGSNDEQRAFSMAIELCLVWINRLLFLKLLEAQILKFHKNDQSCRFLSTSVIADFADLSDLFFGVLAIDLDERPQAIRKKYANIPYLNSSLFERTKLEQSVGINALTNKLSLPLFTRTVLKDANGRRLTGSKNTLAYIFEFLDAYDFGSVGTGNVQTDSKTIINASVLGLIFEKINGYEEGAFFTPGRITMYMARSAIEKLVLDAFRTEYSAWTLTDLDDLRNHVIDKRSKPDVLRFNAIIDRIKICDPAVGSGHFLVSCLNEMIALKSWLGILADATGIRLSDHHVVVDNDELIVVNTQSDEVFSYQIHDNAVPAKIQHVQRTLFHEKEKLIENCLFGVDININSVRICQLRLWIELLKNAYYKGADLKRLETLPNIDINIKCGNSLLSRFTLDQNLSDAFKSANLTVSGYRDLVAQYKVTKERNTKRTLHEKIATAKLKFEQEQLDRLSKRIDVAAATLRNLKNQHELFSHDKAVVARHRAKLDAAEIEIDRLNKEREKLEQKRTLLGALEWRFEFPEVLDDKGEFVGFDLVIANPPYGVSIPQATREHIYRTLGAVPDHEIFYLFINLASHIIKKNGDTCQIVPNSLLFNHFAQVYRERLLHEWRNIQIDDLTEYKIFDGVVVHNIIFHAQRGIGREGISFRRTKTGKSLAKFLESNLEFAAPELLSEWIRNWGLVFRLSARELELIRKVRSTAARLETFFPRISQGLIAYDRHQGQDKSIIETRTYHSNTATTTNKPWLRGEDVTRFRVEWNGTDYIEYSDNLANPREPEFFREARILVREITNPRIFAGYSDDEQYNDPALINILVPTDAVFSGWALLGILNSKLASFYHFNSSPKATKGAFPKILVEDIRVFPLPDPVRCVRLLTRLGERTKKLAQLAGSDDRAEFEALDRQNEIDVYNLYDLRADEVNIVEGYFANLDSTADIGDPEADN